VPAVEINQSVRLVAEALPMKILSGRVRAVARRARSNDREGAPARNSANALGDGWYHVASVEIDATTAPLLPGARGTAKIATYDSTVGKLILDQLRRAFQRVF
jgi:hypothetical protein